MTGDNSRFPREPSRIHPSGQAIVAWLPCASRCHRTQTFILCGQHASKVWHLTRTWRLQKRTKNLVSTAAKCGGFHPRARPAKHRIILTAVGRWLLAADEPCRNRWIEFVGVAGEIGQHLGELIIHEM